MDKLDVWYYQIIGLINNVVYIDYSVVALSFIGVRCWSSFRIAMTMCNALPIFNLPSLLGEFERDGRKPILQYIGWENNCNQV